MRSAPSLPVIRQPLVLRLWLMVLRTPFADGAVTPVLKTLGLPAWRRLPIDDTPTYYPRPPRVPGSLPWNREEVAMQVWQAGGPSRLRVLREGFQKGDWTPVQVAQAFLQAWRQSEADTPSLRAFLRVEEEHVLWHAQASTERWHQQSTLGLLDGIPFGIKDEFHFPPYPTTFGLKTLNHLPTTPSSVVAYWESAGGIPAGKTNMHEFGMGVTGLNLSYGTARNPYHPEHAPGGSSSGSAVAVAAGLVPLALGADAGGSIRLPAAFCGIYGLKPTFGRVSLAHAGPLAWSVSHAGPMAATVTDLAVGFAYLAGPDARDPHTWDQPPLDFKGWNETTLQDMVIGVDRAWMEDTDTEITDALESLLTQLARWGAQVQEVRLPYLDEAMLAHLVTVGTELSHALRTWLTRAHVPFTQVAPDVQSLVAMVRALRSDDYLRAQQWRTRAIRTVEEVLRSAHVLLTPAAAILPPPLPESVRRHGELKTTEMLHIMRFVFLANLTGHPALTLPVGLSREGLPLAVQAIGRYWDEATLLRLAWMMEKKRGPIPLPRRFYDLTRFLS